MNTQPNIMVSAAIALLIHIAVAYAVLWKSNAEEVQFAEISQGIQITLDSSAYQNILQKQQEEKQQALVKKEEPKPIEPKKIKPIKMKVIQQKVISEVTKEKTVTYKVQEEIAEKVEPVTENAMAAAKETIKVASTQNITLHTEQSSAKQKNTAGVAGAESQKSLDMNDSATKRYIAELMRHLNRYKQYPALLKKNHVEGKPVILFSINKSGQVTQVEVKKQSEYAELDQAAMDVFRRASPLPKIPSDLEREILTMSLPIEYSLIND